jgi:hypothetical protein
MLISFLLYIISSLER